MRLALSQLIDRSPTACARPLKRAAPLSCPCSYAHIVFLDVDISCVADNYATYALGYLSAFFRASSLAGPQDPQFSVLGDREPRAGGDG